VKPLFYLQRPILICSALAATVMLSACGQTGPLYMPRVPADPDVQPGAIAVPSDASVRQQQRMPLPGTSNTIAPSPSVYEPNSVFPR
jgi:predicted small lipoprotein YifL